MNTKNQIGFQKIDLRIREIWEEAKEAHRQEIYRELKKALVVLAALIAATALLYLGWDISFIQTISIIILVFILSIWSLFYRAPSFRVLLILRLLEVAKVLEKYSSAPGSAVKKRELRKLRSVCIKALESIPANVRWSQDFFYSRHSQFSQSIEQSLRQIKRKARAGSLDESERLTQILLTIIKTLWDHPEVITEELVIETQRWLTAAGGPLPSPWRDIVIPMKGVFADTFHLLPLLGVGLLIASTIIVPIGIYLSFPIYGTLVLMIALAGIIVGALVSMRGRRAA